MIHIVDLNKKKLAAFMTSAEYKNLAQVPISPQRAASHIANPAAGEGDTLLFLAYDNTELVGYLGTLPDRLFVDNNPTTITWLSCLWINNAHRGKKIAYKLVTHAIKTWDQRVLITEYTGPAERLYDKTKNFTDLAKNTGLRLYLRMNLAFILPPKRPFFKNIKGILSIVDKVFNTIFDLRFKLRSNNLAAHNIEETNIIDDETIDFIGSLQKEQIFKRGKEELQWILDNPWIVDYQTGDPYADKYYFSSLSRSFDFIALKIKDANHQLIAFLIFTKRDEHLKLPYCYYTCEEKILVPIINDLMVKWKVSMFTLFHQKLSSAFMREKTPTLFKKEVQRNYLISKKMKQENFPINFSIQDGDADCSFT